MGTAVPPKLDTIALSERWVRTLLKPSRQHPVSALFHDSLFHFPVFFPVVFWLISASNLSASSPRSACSRRSLAMLEIEVCMYIPKAKQENCRNEKKT